MRQVRNSTLLYFLRDFHARTHSLVNVSGNRMTKRQRDLCKPRWLYSILGGESGVNITAIPQYVLRRLTIWTDALSALFVSSGSLSNGTRENFLPSTPLDIQVLRRNSAVRILKVRLVTWQSFFEEDLNLYNWGVIAELRDECLVFFACLAQKRSTSEDRVRQLSKKVGKRGSCFNLHVVGRE